MNTAKCETPGEGLVITPSLAHYTTRKVHPGMVNKRRKLCKRGAREIQKLFRRSPGE